MKSQWWHIKNDVGQTITRMHVRTCMHTRKDRQGFMISFFFCFLQTFTFLLSVLLHNLCFDYSMCAHYLILLSSPKPGVSKVSWKISAQKEIKSSKHVTLCNHMTQLSLHESPIWARRKSAPALLLHTILCVFFLQSLAMKLSLVL